ncbi:Methyltransferase type 11 [Thermocrinis albus DSM 14484]|uniref:Methyltransferase type 11 n=1 Tax=Thermocrinis albus (strain DSM 14484 / JCM 11386 / HI 11/12) TaxID=638303 RepID=D3SMZ7_THEAH|nr:methyltransferase domain-containing protein [Thermocrinis albus]ADC90127.1 Methyltransferase type 11 [Thermocrinis albus DSM 14484]
MRILSVRFSRACHSYDRWAIPQRESAQILRSIRPLYGRVLDAGCGTGMASQGVAEAVGVDISSGMARRYRETGRTAVVGDLHHLPFKDKSFDFAISNFSLHWTDLTKSIPEILRVVRKGFLGALPVEGSLPHTGFPFPQKDVVLYHLEKWGGKIAVSFIREIAIPFRGMDLVRFLHYTGSTYNPAREPGRVLSRKALADLISKIDSTSFVVLFFYCEV